MPSAQTQQKLPQVTPRVLQHPWRPKGWQSRRNEVNKAAKSVRTKVYKTNASFRSHQFAALFTSFHLNYQPLDLRGWCCSCSNKLDCSSEFSSISPSVCPSVFDHRCWTIHVCLISVKKYVLPLLFKCVTSVFRFQGDHEGSKVDSRLLFKLDYCLPECALKRSQGQHDEEQHLDKVSKVTDENINSVYRSLYSSFDISLENLLVHQDLILKLTILIFNDYLQDDVNYFI